MKEDLQPLRIVHLDTARDLRGGQRQLLLLARRLNPRGHSQLVVCPEGSELEARAGQEGFETFALPGHDPFHSHGTLQLRQRLKAQPLRLVLHAHDGRGQTLAALASAGLPVRRVASRRVTFLPAHRSIHRLKYGSTCHGVIAVSEYVRGLLVSSGIREEKIAVIPDGVEIPPELPGAEERAQARAEWGFSADEFVAGHLGAFTREKGQDVALAALPQLRARLPQARLVLAGEGPEKSSPRFLAELERAGGQVRVLGAAEDVRPFFAGLDVFLMPSRAEGLGSALLLAMARGVPVIASRVGGIPEIVQEGRNGWLVPPEEPAALAEAMGAAAADRARLRGFALDARRRAADFSDDIMAQRTEAFYRRLWAR